GTRFRVGHIHRVVFGDEDAARAAELAPFVEIFPVLIENLNTVVLAIAHEQAPARVHGDGVRLADLTAARSFLPPLFDEPAVFGELDDAIVFAVPMAVGHENIAVWSDEPVGGLIEKIRARAAHARLAERHQYFSVRTEFENLVPFAVCAAR